MSSAGPLVLAVDDLECRHGQVSVVDGVSLEVPAGEKVALTGANGSGKSTLLRAVLGLHPAYRGGIRIDGREQRSARDRQWSRSVVAWMPQRLPTGRFPVQVKEIWASSGDLEAARAAATDLGIGAVADRPLTALSGGQLQRVFLARALGCIAAGARALVADEPTAALDFAGQEDVAQLLADLRVTVLVASHDRAVVERCDRVLEMAAGRCREVVS